MAVDQLDVVPEHHLGHLVGTGLGWIYDVQVHAAFHHHFPVVALNYLGLVVHSYPWNTVEVYQILL